MKWFAVVAIFVIGAFGLTAAAVFLPSHIRHISDASQAHSDGGVLWCPQVDRLSAEVLPPDKAKQAIEYFLQTQPRHLANRFHRWRVEAVLPQARTKAFDDLQVVFSHDEFRRQYPDAPNLIIRTEWGCAVRFASPDKSRITDDEPIQGERHIDQLLATLAEAGVPLEQGIETEWGRTTVAELLESSYKAFVRDQDPVWSLVAYCSYFPKRTKWTNRFGEEISFEMIARGVMARELDDGPCSGTHKQYALTRLLLADETNHILSSNLRLEIQQYLRRCCAALEQSQLPNGSWNFDWAKSEAPTSERMETINTTPWLIHVTAHHLEWLCLLPKDLQPPKQMVERAARFVSTVMIHHSPELMLSNYCTFSHGREFSHCWRTCHHQLLNLSQHKQEENRDGLPLECGLLAWREYVLSIHGSSVASWRKQLHDSYAARIKRNSGIL